MVYLCPVLVNIHNATKVQKYFSEKICNQKKPQKKKCR